MALASVTGLVLSGWLINRFTVHKLFPLTYLPLLGGIALMAVSGSSGIIPVAFVLLGLADGFSRTTTSAVWAELFSVASLQAIGSAADIYTVFVSGLSPFVLGVLFDWGLSVSAVLLWMSAISLTLLDPGTVSTRA